MPMAAMRQARASDPFPKFVIRRGPV